MIKLAWEHVGNDLQLRGEQPMPFSHRSMADEIWQAYVQSDSRGERSGGKRQSS
jgi:hypothetical protein